MDYTKIPRELIYEEKKSLADFGVREDNAANAELYQLLRRYLYYDMGVKSYLPILRHIFNDAYYICTMALLDDSPAERITEYYKIASEHKLYGKKEKDTYAKITLTMVDVYLRRLLYGRLKLHPLRKELKNYHWEYTFILRKLEGHVFPSSQDFEIRELDLQLLEKIDWDKLTNHFQEDLVRELPDVFRGDKNKKLLIVEAIYRALYSNDSIYDVPYNIERHLIRRYEILGGNREDLKSIALGEAKVKLVKSKMNTPCTPSKELDALKERWAKQQEENNVLLMKINYLQNMVSALEKEKEEYKMKANTINMRMSVLIAEQEKRYKESAKYEEMYIQLKKEVDTTLQEAMIEREMSRRQIRELSEKAKMMQEKVGDKTIPLSSLVEGIKRFSKLQGLTAGENLLLSLSLILKKEKVWTDNVDELEDFFIEANDQAKKVQPLHIDQMAVGDNTTMKHD